MKYNRDMPESITQASANIEINRRWAIYTVALALSTGFLGYAINKGMFPVDLPGGDGHWVEFLTGGCVTSSLFFLGHKIAELKRRFRFRPK